MKQIAPFIFFFSPLFLLFTSCDENRNAANHQPIVMGDSSFIVTETDPAYLTDYVMDIQNKRVAEMNEPAPAVPSKPVPVKDSVVSTPDQGKGLSIPFKEVTVFIPNISVRTYGNQNPEKSNGATYEITEGKLAGNTLQIREGKPTSVSQRYGTSVFVTNGKEKLQLEGLDNLTDWKKISGSNNSYPIKGLEESRMEVKKVSPAQIRNAVSRAARNKKLSRAAIQEWERTVRNVKSLDQKPVSSFLKSVMWKIDGKDAQGKSYSKQVRIDVPE